jgi:hypothetical protein
MPDSTVLPAEFADLQELADIFAIADDEERGVAESAASPAKRKQLVSSLRPRFGAINDYLDEHDDESAHLLGRLAEAACEVQIELKRSGQ